MFAVPPLPRTFVAALRDTESKRADIRRSALVDLVRFTDTDERRQIVEVLTKLLRSDKDASVRAMAAIAGADAALNELVPELLAALDDPEPRVQQMALLALGELGEGLEPKSAERVSRLLTSPLPALRYQALVAWRRLSGKSGVAKILVALDDADPEVRWIAWSLLEESVEESLRDDGRTRPPASTERTENVSVSRPDATGDASAVEALRQTLSSRADDTTLRVQAIAASVLLRLNEPAPMLRLLERVENSAGVSRDDLITIAQRFGRLKFEPARAWLTRRARRGWFEGAMGWPATVALAALGDPATERVVLAELDASASWRRRRALQAVSELRMLAAIDRVKQLEKRTFGADAWLVRETLNALEGDPGRNEGRE